MADNLLSFTISFLIGLLIGLEREHSHTERVGPIGIRTFILLSLMGTLAAILNVINITLIICVFVFCLILFGYLRSSKLKITNIGITTEISAGLVFCLGYLVHFQKLTAIIVSSLVLLVLVERQRLHILAKNKFKPHEIEAAIILVIFALGVLPILPDKAIDPWGLFNPRIFSILITTIAVIQFSGYIAIRLFGERFGIAVTGLLGGFISSTIVFTNLPELLRLHSTFKYAILAAAILATLSMLIEIFAILFIASPELLSHILIPLITMMTACICISFGLIRYQQSKGHSKPVLSNPLNIYSIFRTSLFLSLTLILIIIVRGFFGNKGIIFISFLGGLFEIHGITLGTALLFLAHKLNSASAVLIIYIAIFASFVSKLFLLWTLSPKKFALYASILLSIILLSGVLSSRFISPISF